MEMQCVYTLLAPELKCEGLAKELVRSIQDAGKQAKPDVSDRIRLRISGDSQVANAMDEHRPLIAAETLTELWAEDDFDAQFTIEHDLEDRKWQIQLSRVQPALFMNPDHR